MPVNAYYYFSYYVFTIIFLIISSQPMSTTTRGVSSSLYKKVGSGSKVMLEMSKACMNKAKGRGQVFKEDVHITHDFARIIIKWFQ
jgi:hypothetical protein